MNATPLQKHAVWQLIKPFWVSEERWRAWMMLIAIVVLSLGLVYISVQINQWNQVFYDALQNKNYPVFKAQLWRFTYLALIFIVLAVYKIYLTQGLQMRWRRWMTEKFMEKWLAHQAYYHTEQQQIVDNPDQRIAEDLNVLTQYTLSLSLGLLSSLVTLFSFIDILWHVSGPMTFALGQHAITLPGYMVWFALLYAVLGSLLIWWVGKPLVMLGFNQERYEANFRFGLIRIRENNDAIALYHGEPREAQQLGDRFDTIRSNWWAIMRITRRLNIATNFYGQFAIVFPLLVAAPRYFSGAIQMGGLMQIASAFGQVQGALSWFIDAFNDLATWKACVNRLAGFNAAVDQVHHQPRGIQLREESAHPLTLDNLSLNLPDGQPLLAGAEDDAATRRSPADRRPFRLRQVDAAAGHRRYLALRHGGYRGSGQCQHAVPAAAQLHSDRHAARSVELPEPGVGIQRSAADAGAGKLPPEAPAALAGYLRQLEPPPVAGRATAAGVRPRPVDSPEHPVPRRGHQRAGRRNRTVDVLPAGG